MKTLYLTFLFVFTYTILLASSTPKIDELKQEYISCLGDSCRSTGALRIGTTYLSTDLDSTLHYCTIAQKYNNANLNRGFQINIIKGIAHLRRREFPQVDSIYKLLEPEADKVNDGLKTAYYGNASNFYYRQEKYDLALQYSLKSIEVLDTTNVDYRVSVYGNVANIYSRMNNYQGAIEILNELHHFILRQDIPEQEKNLYLSEVEYRKVLMYKKVGDWKSIRERYKSILSYDIQDTSYLVRYLNGYGNFCLKQDSIEELGKTLIIMDGLVGKMRKESELIYQDLKVDFLTRTEQFQKAKLQNEKFRFFLSHNSFSKDDYLYLNNKAEILLKENKIGQAHLVYAESLKELKLIKEDEVYLNTLRAYLSTAQSTNAQTLSKLREYTTLKDSLHELAYTNRVAYMDGKFKSDKLKNENQVLALSNDIKETKIKSQRSGFIGLLIGLFLVSLLSYLLFRRYKKEKKLSNELYNKSNELSLLNREMKHRSRGYLNTAINMLSEQRRNSDVQDLESALYKTELRIRALSCVSSALDNTELFQTKFKELITELIKDLTYNFDKEIETSVSIDNLNLDNHQVISLALITNELVFNSLKYAFDGTANPQLQLSIKSVDDKIKYDYSDNGSGLDGTIKGTGEGRSIISDFVAQVHGLFEETNDLGYRFKMEFNKLLNYA